MKLHVREAESRDAGAMASIYNEGIRERVATFETRERTPEEMLQRIGVERFPTLVAEWDGEVVGWVGASAYSARESYRGIAEFSIYVSPLTRGLGTGSALMEAFLPACARAGFWKVLSRVFPENQASRKLLARHGFREVGIFERHARLDGEWRDVVIVERLLEPAA